MSPLVTRTGVGLTADASRVLARLFVPGRELLADRESRATGVLARVLDLPDDAAERTLADVVAGFGHRHRDLPGVLAHHFEQVAHRLDESETAALSPDRRALVGAWFTNEYAVEGAALFNPSAVPHPDQGGLAPGQLRFVMSLRAVGEGHLSSVGFRTGVVGPGQQLVLDDPGPHVETGTVSPTLHDRDLFAAKLADAGADTESASYLVRRLDARFDEVDLERALVSLATQPLTRQGGTSTEDRARHLLRCSYEVAFPPATTIAERVLWPQGPSESHGLEDARFVRVELPDGSSTYRATYTAYDGQQIAPQLIETADFATFRVSQLAGPAARDKGMALFPRTVGGRYLALSRSDRETTGVTSSADGRWWDAPVAVHAPHQPWELIQTGNCGSPVETDRGWLVLTHGVGPMRQYAIGALLLDLDDPTEVVGELRGPLMSPEADERDGYVPNVLYSCGALRHGDQLLLPYGASDASVRFAFVDLPALVERVLADGPPPVTTGAPAATRANSSA